MAICNSKLFVYQRVKPTKNHLLSHHKMFAINHDLNRNTDILWFKNLHEHWGSSMINVDYLGKIGGWWQLAAVVYSPVWLPNRNHISLHPAWWSMSFWPTKAPFREPSRMAIERHNLEYDYGWCYDFHDICLVIHMKSILMSGVQTPTLDQQGCRSVGFCFMICWDNDLLTMPINQAQDVGSWDHISGHFLSDGEVPKNIGFHRLQ